MPASPHGTLPSALRASQTLNASVLIAKQTQERSQRRARKDSQSASRTSTIRETAGSKQSSITREALLVPLSPGIEARGDMIGQFEAERDAAGLHSPLQLRQKKTPPAVIAEQVISEIGRAIGAQIEGVRVDLLELAETLPATAF